MNNTQTVIETQDYEILVYQDSGFHVWEERNHISKIAIIVESRGENLDWADELPFHDDESYTEWLNSDIFIRKYPLYIYDHSGVCFSITNDTYPFNTGWDTAHVGWIYILKEGNEGMSKEEATKIILEDIQEINTYYLEGFLGFGVVHKHTGEILESIGCFLGMEEVKRGIKEYLNPEFHNLPTRYV